MEKTVIGVVGGGQLGQMLGLAAIPLGVSCRFLEPSVNPPAERAGEVLRAFYDEGRALEEFSKGLTVATFEFENVPAATIEYLSKHTSIAPSVRSLAVSQDRVFEKELFSGAGIKCAAWRAIDSAAELPAKVSEVGLPCVLKTRRLGYDGKGQKVVRTSEDMHGAWEQLGSVPLIVEALIPFEREVSIIAVRSKIGDIRFYSPVWNLHREGMLRFSVPLQEPALCHRAEELATKLLHELDHVGILTVETFQVGSELIANEIAPRVHNSGHWTIEGAETSQFTNHLLAVLGWPLGSTALMRPTAMINLIGEAVRPDQFGFCDGACLHLYGKEARHRRKLGHITVTAPNPNALAGRLAACRRFLLEEDHEGLAHVCSTLRRGVS